MKDVENNISVDLDEKYRRKLTKKISLDLIPKLSNKVWFKVMQEVHKAAVPVERAIGDLYDV
jgi:hypothetical protein